MYMLHLFLYNPFHSGSYTEAPRIKCRSRRQNKASASGSCSSTAGPKVCAESSGPRSRRGHLVRTLPGRRNGSSSGKKTREM